MKASSIAIVSLACVLLALPAAAQLSAEGGPIGVDSDRTETFERENKVLVIGNVDIQQGDARLRADRVTLIFAGNGRSSSTGLSSGFGDIKTMMADGDVFYITPELKARGDHATYDAATGVITMTGNVKMSRDKDVGEGEMLRIETATGRSVLDGGDGRVRVMLDPASGTQN